MTIGEKLKACRLAKELTQAQVATTIHVSRKTISGWENNRSYPDVASLVRLSDLYAVALDDLLRDNHLLTHYQQAEQTTLRTKKLTKVTYSLNILWLILTYLSIYSVFGLHMPYVPLLLIINTIVFLTHFSQWDRFKLRRQRVKLEVSFLAGVLLNAIVSIVLLSLGVGEKLVTADEYHTIGIVAGHFTLLCFLTISLLIIIFFKNEAPRAAATNGDESIVPRV
ncbi:helix-turn-helix domain-containing protein [Levilactobacillus enshiensis]|uniref:helix-turn-helix domain-containing protein n=1 Tax=Levilactobacillus enshiensis TaxID=2590213 RepID=UPI00131E0C7E|nr:helix-turn-helix transcriptional regulator [Levilactobacillus enshiensis]